MNDDIILMLRPLTDDIQMHLPYIPYRRFLNLIVLYMVAREIRKGGKRSEVDLHILDDHEMMLRGIRNEEDLYEIALENTERRFPPSITDLSEGLFVLSNRHNIFGATSLLYKDEMKALAEYAGANVYVVPDSIHEVMCIRQDAVDPSDIYELVSSADPDMKDEEDHLSDSVYFYDRDTDKLMIAYADDGYYM